MINGQFTYHVKNEVFPTATSSKTACMRIDRIIHDLFEANESSQTIKRTSINLLFNVKFRQRNCWMHFEKNGQPSDWLKKNYEIYAVVCPHESRESLLWLYFEKSKTTRLILLFSRKLSINFNVINILCRLTLKGIHHSKIIVFWIWENVPTNSIYRINILWLMSVVFCLDQ